MLSNGFAPNSCDKYLCIKVRENIVIFIFLYVDDMLIVSKKMNEVLETKRFVTSKFKMRDLGLVHTILVIKIKRNVGDYELSETHYVVKMLDKLKRLCFKEVNTTFDPSDN